MPRNPSMARSRRELSGALARDLYDQIWPTWWQNKVATFIFSWKISFFILFSKEQALKPCSGPRSRDSTQIRQIESSPNPNLTDLVKKQGRTFWVFVIFQATRDICSVCDERITTGKTGRLICLRFGHRIDWSLVYWPLPIFPVVTFSSLVSGQRTKGRPPNNHFLFIRQQI